MRPGCWMAINARLWHGTLPHLFSASLGPASVLSQLATRRLPPFACCSFDPASHLASTAQSCAVYRSSRNRARWLKENPPIPELEQRTMPYELTGRNVLVTGGSKYARCSAFFSPARAPPPPIPLRKSPRVPAVRELTTVRAAHTHTEASAPPCAPPSRGAGATWPSTTSTTRARPRGSSRRWCASAASKSSCSERCVRLGCFASPLSLSLSLSLRIRVCVCTSRCTGESWPAGSTALGHHAACALRETAGLTGGGDRTSATRASARRAWSRPCPRSAGWTSSLRTRCADPGGSFFPRLSVGQDIADRAAPAGVDQVLALRGPRGPDGRGVGQGKGLPPFLGTERVPPCSVAHALSLRSRTSGALG